ncbi:hypothetical protein DFH08DRAFT_978038 [Mycena albidolilacea]|uniref:Uncharacterized protein n=1 Tax=Mycena albidolilacea TaxID=1033008 RepID=A0AAD6YZD8_9AGAR|nr:hypothetical protein DFH08DRAFT_978038 [Mycena albidolilacea]
MELWEADSANPNPFKVAEKPEGLFAIRGRLADEAVTAVAGDEADDVRGDLHAHEMVDMGLQLEEQQRDLAVDSAAIKLHATDRQKTALLERSNKLGRKITEWLKIRESFTPMVATLRTEEDAACAGSSSSAYTSSSRPCGQAVVTVAVGSYAQHQRTASPPARPDSQIPIQGSVPAGVAANTRANTSIANVDERIRRTAAQYRVARLALVSLGPILEETDWKLKLRPLSQDDVRQRPRATFSDPEHKTRKKRRKKDTPAQAAEALRKKEENGVLLGLLQLSEEGRQTGMAEALRIEWAKTRARAWRWTEEVDLVEEEMRRVLEFQRWKAEWWMGLMNQHPSAADDQTLREGAGPASTLRGELEGSSTVHPAGTRQPRQDPPGSRGRGAAAREEEEEEEEEEEDAEAAVPEVAADAQLIASFVEESLASL